MTAEIKNVKVTRRFNLRLWFISLSLLTIVGWTILSGFMLSAGFNETMSLQQAEIANEFLQSDVHAHDVKDYFRNWHANLSAPEMHHFFGRLVQMPNVFQVIAYNPDRQIIWNSTGRRVGEQVLDNMHLNNSLDGNIAVEMIDYDPGQQAGHQQSVKPEGSDSQPATNSHRIIVSYLPVNDDDENAVVGVIQINKLAPSFFKALGDHRFAMWRASGMGSVFLFCVLCFLIFYADLLIRRQQQQLLAIQSMVTLGKMTPHLAHILRNPLASIRSSAELIAEDENDETAEYANNIMLSVDQLDIWLQDVLSLSQLEKLDEGFSNVDKVIRSSLSKYQSFLNENQIAVDYQAVDPQIEAAIPRRQLSYVIKGIIKNAFEAMPKKGRLDIRHDLRSKETLLIEFSDSGGGLDESVTDSLFNPFVTTKTKAGGLTLAFSRMLMARMGGEISVIDRSSGKGVIVTLRLPLHGNH